jgi:hypothetical protein
LRTVTSERAPFFVTAHPSFPMLLIHGAEDRIPLPLAVA